jgi:hypothetical protein
VNLKSSNKGFAMIFILALLPALIAGFLLVVAGVGIIQNQQRLQYICRNNGLAGQEKVAPLMMALMALNPLAQQLTVQMYEKMAEIAASDGFNVKAEAELARIMKKKMQLRERQNQIIKQANMILGAANFVGYGRQLSSLKEFETHTPLFSISSFSLPQRNPKLSVVPEYPDIAPPYRPSKDFEKKEALVQKWQYHLSIAKPFSSFLDGAAVFDQDCAVTMKEDRKIWQSKVTEVKSL